MISRTAKESDSVSLFHSRSFSSCIILHKPPEGLIDLKGVITEVATGTEKDLLFENGYKSASSETQRNTLWFWQS